MDEKKKLQKIIAIKKWIWDYEWKWENKKPYNKPILVLGPTLGTTKGEPSTFLRVYAYGGRLFDIRTNETNSKNAKNKHKFDKEFLKYAHPEYYYDKKNQINMIPESFKNHYSPVYEKYKNYKDIKNLLFNINSFERIENKEDSKKNELLDFIVLGMKNNNTKIDGSKKERWIQTEIVKEYISKKYVENDKEEQYLIFDMEYRIELDPKRNKSERKGGKTKLIPNKFSETTELDLILFDGKKFGFVELKYNGESMDSGSDNDLREHYLDFNVAKKQMRKVQKELLRRLWFLFHYQIIDVSWKNAFSEIGVCKEIWNMTYDEMKMEVDNIINSKIFDYWYGFLFWNDEKCLKEQNSVLEDFKNQVKPEFEDKNFNMPLKFCYYDTIKDNKIKFIETSWKMPLE